MTISPYALPGIDRNDKISPRVVRRNCIANTVARHFKIEVEQMQSKSRLRKYVIPRQIALTLMREAGFSLKESSLHFNRDHATTHYAHRIVEEQMKLYPQFSNEVSQLAFELGITLKFKKQGQW